MQLRQTARPQVTILGFLYFQLLLVPALLAPVYYYLEIEEQPYTALLAFALAPICYVALRLWRAQYLRSEKRPESLLIGVRDGGCFGAAFGVTLLIPMAIVWSLDPRNPRISAVEVIRESWKLLSAIGFVLFYYVTIGAATGGVITLLQRAWRMRRERRESRV